MSENHKQLREPLPESSRSMLLAVFSKAQFPFIFFRDPFSNMEELI